MPKPDYEWLDEHPTDFWVRTRYGRGWEVKSPTNARQGYRSSAFDTQSEAIELAKRLTLEEPKP